MSCVRPPPGVLLPLSLLAHALSEVGAKELKYPTGVRPGDQVSGSEGEYFRYKSVFVKPPDDDDRVESLRMASDVMCPACEVMLHSLVQRAESLSEDHIMDQLDGELEGTVALTDNPQDNRVNQNRKGCNKHFKDELLLRGFAVRKCQTPESAGPSGGSTVWCLEELSARPTDRDVDTYTVQNEAAFYSCENTIGRYGQELASFVADRVESGVALLEVVREACREAARCAGKRDPKKTRRRKGNRKHKKAKDTDDGEL